MPEGSFDLSFIKTQKREDSNHTMAKSAVLSSTPQEIETTYANMIGREESMGKTVINVEDLLEVYNSMSENDGSGFEKEYLKLRGESNFSHLTTNVASGEKVKKKNRYRNILPYDHTRVTLEGDEGYINASFVDGFHQLKKFIATQGPTPATISDFWMMILQNKCSVVVMLTRCSERGRKKCEKYWPEHGTCVTFGEIKVENIEEAESGSYIRRKLIVKHGDKKSQTTQMFQFVRWPDHGVPTTTSGLIRFHRAVKKAQNEGGQNAPVVVHCSAGAGRSGAFIAFDKLIEESESSNKVDIFTCVLEMRKQRAEMVQTKDQYSLVYKLILEKCLLGNTELKIEDVSIKLNRYLRSEDTETIRKEFDRLSKVGPMNAQIYGSEYSSMNRDESVLSYEHSRVIVVFQAEDKNSPYVNASSLEMYDDCTSLIAAQGPLKNTVEYFWRAVYDNDVNTIVMLTSLHDGDKEECVQYWPESVKGSLTFGGITVELIKQKDAQEHVIERVLKITRKSIPKTILHLQYTDWISDACPNDASTVIKLIDRLAINVGSEIGKNGLVHCSDGAGRTGTFCAIFNLLEQLKRENRVDVFRAVKDLRDCRTGMIRNIGQYVFCHRAVIDSFHRTDRILTPLDDEKSTK